MVDGGFCEQCGEPLRGAAFCTSCGTAARLATAVPGCATCGHSLEHGASFCVQCGTVVSAAEGTTGAVVPPPKEASSGSELRLVLAAVAVVAMVGLGWLALGRLTDNDGRGGSNEAAELRAETSDEREDGTAEDAAVDEDLSTGAIETTTTTLGPSTTSTTIESTTTTTSFFAPRSVVYGRYVAVLWSDFVPSGSSAETPELEAELASSQRRFGPNVIAINSNDFGSVRNGTVAVVYDGGFSSAREAKRWCRDNGFSGTQDCFGVVLSDDYAPDERGEFIRVYDL